MERKLTCIKPSVCAHVCALFLPPPPPIPNPCPACKSGANWRNKQSCMVCASSCVSTAPCTHARLHLAICENTPHTRMAPHACERKLELGPTRTRNMHAQGFTSVHAARPEVTRASPSPAGAHMRVHHTSTSTHKPPAAWPSPSPFVAEPGLQVPG